MRNFSSIFAALTGAVLTTLSLQAAEDTRLGYRDTPMLPDQPWRVHDSARPRPASVTPGQNFSLGAQAPSDAVVLFDGTDLSKWKSDKGEARWKVENGYMQAVKNAGSIFTKDEFGDFQLHIEFAEPEVIDGDSQGRGNSGVLIYGRFEVQVLDTFTNLTYADGQCGAMYGQYPPLANATKPPGVWQGYDIIFEAPHWDDSGKLVKKAAVTVIHNGVVLHNHKEYIGETKHREVANYAHPFPPHGPILLQDHGNPVRYRNIWIRKLGEYDKS